MRVTKKEKQKHSIVSWNIANTTTTASLGSVKKSEKKLTNRQTHECSKTKSIYVYAEILTPHRCTGPFVVCLASHSSLSLSLCLITPPVSKDVFEQLQCYDE